MERRKIKKRIEDIIPNFEIDYDNGGDDELDSEYEYENYNEMTKDEVLQRLWILKI